MFIALLCSMTLICCTNEEDAIVLVKVEKSGSPVSNEAVYMFPGTDTIYVINSVKAGGMEITDANGIAEFTVKRLSIGEEGTYRIFETFGENGIINGRVAAYISSGARRIPLTLKQNVKDN